MDNAVVLWRVDCKIYLIMALCPPDMWPKGDIALQTAIQAIKQLPKRATSAKAQSISVAWRPWRAVAAQLLWHSLSQRWQTYT